MIDLVAISSILAPTFSTVAGNHYHYILLHSLIFSILLCLCSSKETVIVQGLQAHLKNNQLTQKLFTGWNCSIVSINSWNFGIRVSDNGFVLLLNDLDHLMINTSTPFDDHQFHSLFAILPNHDSLFCFIVEEPGFGRVLVSSLLCHWELILLTFVLTIVAVSSQSDWGFIWQWSPLYKFEHTPNRENYSDS